MKRRRSFVVSLLVFAFGTVAARDDGLFAGLRDAEDGAFDLSDFLQGRTGFLPVPIVITEPAVGYGGGLAPLFIKRDPSAVDQPGRFAPPRLFGAAGFYTENGSWGAGGFYFLPLFHDRVRWAGGAAYTDLNLKFYGFGPDSPLQDNPLEFEFLMTAVFQRIQARVGASDLFVGLQYAFLGTKSRFAGGLPPEIPPSELAVNVGGLGGTVEYDTRDNFLSPQTGMDLFGSGTAFEPAFGSDRSFGRARVQTIAFGKVSPRWGYGVRFDAKYAWGDMPFFMRPALTMRGLTAGQYLDKVAVLAEAEPRYWVDKRWMLLAFGGVGRVGPSWSDLSGASNVWSAGFGFRYLIARKLGLQAGLDFGFGPSGSNAFYIQIGSPWR